MTPEANAILRAAYKDEWDGPGERNWSIPGTYASLSYSPYFGWTVNSEELGSQDIDRGMARILLSHKLGDKPPEPQPPANDNFIYCGGCWPASCTCGSPDLGDKVPSDYVPLITSLRSSIRELEARSAELERKLQVIRKAVVLSVPE